MPYGVNTSDHILDVASGSFLLTSPCYCLLAHVMRYITAGIGKGVQGRQEHCLCAGAVTSSKLEAAAALEYLIACSERYAAAFPEEDGYRRPETLSEEVLGSDLWNAARVSWACTMAAANMHACIEEQSCQGCLFLIAGSVLQSRKSMAESRHGLLSVDLNSKESLASSSSSEQEYTAEVSSMLFAYAHKLR